MGGARAMNILAKIYCKLKDILAALTRLIVLNSGDDVEPTLYCDEDCNITGAIAFIRDKETGEVVPVYFDTNLEVTDVAPLGSPCGAKCSIDIEITEKCYKDSDENQYTQLTILTFQGTVKTGSSVCWLLPNGDTTETTPAGLVPCEGECEPQISGGDASSPPNFGLTDFTLVKPSCNCEVEIVTSVGNITAYNGMESLCTPPVDCPINVEGLNITPESTCNPSEVKWYASRRK